MQEKFTISFCTCIYESLGAYEKTLHKNIGDTMYNDNLEFLALDYNSKDGLEE